MRINAVRNNEVDITLNADELCQISKFMYSYEENADTDKLKGKSGAIFHELYAQIVIARDLCQYGHLDNVSLLNASKHRISACPENRLGEFEAMIEAMKERMD